MAKVLDFYIDFTSPFTYLCNLKLPDLAAKYGYQLNYHPIDIPTQSGTSSRTLVARSCRLARRSSPSGCSVASSSSAASVSLIGSMQGSHQGREERSSPSRATDGALVVVGRAGGARTHDPRIMSPLL